MYKNKFYLAYDSLHAKEQNEFKRYLLVNHSEKKIVVKVFEKLCVNKKDEHLANASKKEIFAQVFDSKTTFNFRKITDAFSDLYLLLEDFLLWKHLANDKSLEKDFLLLDIFKAKNCEDLFNQKMNQIRKKQAKQQSWDIWFLLSKMKLDHYQYFFSDYAKLEKGKSRVATAMDHLDLFFVATKLRYSCEMKSRENILQEKYEIEYLNAIINQDAGKEKYSTIYFEIYSLTLQMIETQDEQIFYKLKKMLFDNIKVFKPKELMSIFTYLINFTAAEIKKGNADFIKEAFDLYQIGLDKWVFIDNNYMPHTKFNNIINVACDLNEFDWANDFIEQWKYYLSKKVKKSAVAIGRARLFFEQKQFNAAIELLNQTEFSNTYYAIRAKTLLIRSHYELKTNSDVIIHMCLAFETFIQRNALISKETKTGFINFVRVLKKILRKVQKKKKVDKNMKLLSPIAYERWVFEKLEEF